MSFLDRIPKLWAKKPPPSVDGARTHVLRVEEPAIRLVKTGKWVVHSPTKAVGILVSAADFPNCRVMLVDERGEDSVSITCALTDLKVARLVEIPLKRRPTADAGAVLGYY
jgi:hypothetical protein